jgi:predicted alpha/beta-fold hydrolase
MEITIPQFRPCRWLRGAHAQTLAGFWMPCEKESYSAKRCAVTLADGDQVVLHDDCPASWPAAGPVAFLLPGLCGSHRSSYMVRAAAKLSDHGVRVFRMDPRGCGAGRGLSRRPYHAGISEDVAEALNAIARLCPRSPVNLVGFSMGGNLALKLAGENLPANVASVLAFSPAIDLTLAAAALNRRVNRFYDRYFLRYMRDIVTSLAGITNTLPLFRSVHELNEYCLTRLWHFGTLTRYYNRASAIRFLPSIRVPTLIVTAADDPIVPVHSFARARLSRVTRLVITERGGHLGFIGRTRPADPDHRWMDWRVVDWVLAQSPSPAWIKSNNNCFAAAVNRMGEAALSTVSL